MSTLQFTVTHSLRRAMAPGLFDELRCALSLIPVEASVSLGLVEGDDAAWSVMVISNGHAIADRVKPQSARALAGLIRRLLHVPPPRPPYRPGLDFTATSARRQAEEARWRARVASLVATRSWFHLRYGLAARHQSLPAPLGPGAAAAAVLARRAPPASRAANRWL